MPKKKICWVTPDWFVDVDLPIVPHLLDEYDITWIIFFPWRNNRFKEEDFKLIMDEHSDLKVCFIHCKYYGLDPRSLKVWNHIGRIIKSRNPDFIYYNNAPGLMNLLMYRALPADKTIVTAHDGCVKPTMKFNRLTRFCWNKGYNTRKYVQFFSPKQAEIFNAERPGKRLFCIPLALKDFGMPTKELRKDYITFVSFGAINEDKNVKLLIKAAEKIYDDGYHNFRVVIKGRCFEWDKEYLPLIKHPELFEADLRFIDNSEIANIYSENTYAVFPYKQSGQSGAIKVALFYRKPCIVSNLAGFTDDIRDGYNGFVFKNENVDDLARVLKHCIDLPKDEYMKLVSNVNEFVDAKYATDKLVGLYRNMFESVLSIND